MGLTNSSTGKNAADSGLLIRKRAGTDRVIALAGNPNVGKSTVFNGLTGMNQHTGNWPGKTVANAQGYCETEKNGYVLVDIPGAYSLMAHSAEEEIARDFICSGVPDAVVVVCDATCLERNLNLVLQTMEITDNVLVCVNLMDEAKRKHIRLELPLLSERLGVPVIGITARRKGELRRLTAALDGMTGKKNAETPPVLYPEAVERAISVVETAAASRLEGRCSARFAALRLLGGDAFPMGEDAAGMPDAGPQTAKALEEAREILAAAGIDRERLTDVIVSSLVARAHEACQGAVTYEKKEYASADRRIDRILTGKLTGYPVMLLLLALIFWLTIEGANIPSGWLSCGFNYLETLLTGLFHRLNAPSWLHGLLILGVYRVLAWVVSVMLPPMAIFFPLFTLLEDAGYLPRVAYNLDKPFRRCNACGKQALTMCMGFGCNAAGIVGCRIIDSPRERLLAILTNNFVPCNGRFPTLIALLAMFFVTASGGFGTSLLTAGLLTALIVFGILVTFGVTRLLSKTVLRGVPSSFTLELPPYRRPQLGKVLVRSVFDRTLFVLGRAAAVAAPAGAILWLTANIHVGGASVLSHLSSFFDPFAGLMGMDGVILVAFILGFPANEIVLPIIIMAYTAQGSLTETASLSAMRELLVSNGWEWTTAVSVMLFALMHWPCSTALLTVKKETGSWKWTGLAALLPTVFGILACMLFTVAVRLVTAA